MSAPTLAALASALIEVFEGCRLAAYRDAGGVWTIGIGHTRDVREGLVITRDEADTFFAEDQAGLLALVKEKPLLAGAALASFGFNCGRGALEEVLAGKIRLEDRVHDRAGNVEPGLVARRRLESLLIALAAEVAPAPASAV